MQTQIKEESLNEAASGPCLGSPGKRPKGVMETQSRYEAWHNGVIGKDLCQRSIGTQTGASNGEHKISRKRVGFLAAEWNEAAGRTQKLSERGVLKLQISLQTSDRSPEGNAAVTIRHI